MFQRNILKRKQASICFAVSQVSQKSLNEQIKQRQQAGRVTNSSTELTLLSAYCVLSKHWG